MTVKGGTEIYAHTSNRSPATDNLRYPPRRPKFACVALKNSLDSLGALKSNQWENFAQRISPCRRPYSGRTIVPKAMLYAQMSRWRPAGGCLSYHQGGRRWLTYSLSARARVHQFQRVSEPSGFSSKAFLASLFRCAARPAVKCTNGTPRMRG